MVVGQELDTDLKPKGERLLPEPKRPQSGPFFGTRGTPAGFTARAFTKAMGFTDEDIQKPVIGIAQTWSEFNNCNAHLRQVAEAVKRGVWQSGGLPLEFPTISLGEVHTKPTTMLFRNLMAMDTEEMIRAQPMDGVVLLSGCDKTTTAQLMGAASANIPTLMVTGGPMLNGSYDGHELGACTDCGKYITEFRAGKLSIEDFCGIEDSICRSAGHCMVMGTASTMACLAEAMGMQLPGSAAIPAPDVRRLQIAELSGRMICELVQRGIRMSDIVTREALENAIRVMMALGGSTNAVIHLVAIAGRLGIDLPLTLFDELSRTTPFLTNVKPSGAFQMEELFAAGGVPAVMHELAPLLHRDVMTVSGKTLAENLAHCRPSRDRNLIRPLTDPISPEGGTAILFGNLAPDGAVIKQSAATPALLRHRGRAVVFTSGDDLHNRFDDPDLDIGPDDVMVLRNAGPVGNPGMPETGFMPIPTKLLRQGVRDIVRISDARMSGTSYGTVVLHIAPEAAIGGPLALVQTGDWIELDVPNRRITLDVPDEELESRRAEWRPGPQRFTRGYTRLYVEHVLQAPQGCDFDFMRQASSEPDSDIYSLSIGGRLI
jgi:dihydroxy-acid dehydratase